MKYLVFGNGQVGNFYKNFFEKKGDEVVIASADITKIDDVRKAVVTEKPDTVINTAARTNLEWCGENRLEAFNVNVLGAGNVAQICDEENVYMVHFSSGCIFNSSGSDDVKNEDSIPNPSSYYGWTKVWSEQIVQFERSKDFKFLILRPRQPVSAQLSPKNMLVKMLTFSKYVDTPNSGTVIEDLMEWTDHLVKQRATGVYHVANIGWTTPYNIGLMIKEFIMPDVVFEKIEKAELDKMTPNTRVDTVLNVDKLIASGAEVRDYETRLKEIAKQLGENIKKSDKEVIKKVLEETATASKQRTVLNEQYLNLFKS